jgi:hypothetical protein
VLAVICLEVVHSSEPQGPARSVRIIEHPEMAEAARRLVADLQLSGFCGFDFILAPNGEARLIELNPRVTPTCHLLVEGTHLVGHVLTLFPAPASSPDAPTMDGVLDVPIRAPRLVQAARRRDRSADR